MGGCACGYCVEFCGLRGGVDGARGGGRGGEGKGGS